jgi:hypothetical protein
VKSQVYSMDTRGCIVNRDKSRLEVDSSKTYLEGVDDDVQSRGITRLRFFISEGRRRSLSDVLVVRLRVRGSESFLVHRELVQSLKGVGR